MMVQITYLSLYYGRWTKQSFHAEWNEDIVTLAELVLNHVWALKHYDFPYCTVRVDADAYGGNPRYYSLNKNHSIGPVPVL